MQVGEIGHLNKPEARSMKECFLCLCQWLATEEILFLDTPCICALSSTKRLVKSFPSHIGPWGGADLHLPQPDTSLHCEAMNTGLGMPVYSPAFAGTKLYCLVTEARRCK